MAKEANDSAMHGMGSMGLVALHWRENVQYCTQRFGSGLPPVQWCTGGSYRLTRVLKWTHVALPPVLQCTGGNPFPPKVLAINRTTIIALCGCCMVYLFRVAILTSHYAFICAPFH